MPQWIEGFLGCFILSEQVAGFFVHELSLLGDHRHD